MAIFNIYLDLDKDYILLIKDVYKFLVIAIIFQILIYYSGCSKNIINTAICGNLMNDDFMSLILFVIVGYVAYYLVFDKIVDLR